MVPMRPAITCALLALASCSKPEAAVPPVEAGTFAGAGRDALCIAGGADARRAGFVVYGAGDANCSVNGRIEAAGTGWTLVPTGEESCRIALALDDGKVALGAQSEACNYYCGPGASFAGRTFARADAAAAVRDFAGDPLC